MGGPHCHSLEVLPEQSQLSPELSPPVYQWRCTWSLGCPGMQDLILCVLSHEVWEGSSHPGLPVCNFSLLLPSYMPFTCPLSLGSMCEGLLSQQSNYPACQKEQQHFVQLTQMFCLFLLFFPAIWSALLGHHSLLCPSPAALPLCTYCPAVVSAAPWKVN